VAEARFLLRLTTVHVMCKRLGRSARTLAGGWPSTTGLESRGAKAAGGTWSGFGSIEMLFLVIVVVIMVDDGYVWILEQDELGWRGPRTLDEVAAEIAPQRAKMVTRR
jgi:hypothetical protein